MFLLVTPLSHWAWFVAYVGASVVRGLAVGLGVFAVTVWFAPPGLAQPLWILVFALLGAGMLGALGLIAGLWAEKFDQMAAFQNFIIMPMTFLSGVFYSVHSLPAFWQRVSHLNPFFYMIDGFRRGFFGVSDVSPWLSLGVVGAQLRWRCRRSRCTCCKTGYKICGTEFTAIIRPPCPSPHPSRSATSSPPAWPASTSRSRATAATSSPPSCRRAFAGKSRVAAPPAGLRRAGR